MLKSKKSAVSVKQQQAEMKGEQIMPDISERDQWIEESAYYIAEARGFIPGYEQDDWKMAEKKYSNCVAA